MIIDNCNAWQVRLTFPTGSLGPNGEVLRWAHNNTITAVSRAIQDALGRVAEQWPHAEIWAINHVGGRTIMLVDEAVAVRKEET